MKHAIDLTVIDRIVVYVEAPTWKEAIEKIKTVKDLNKYKREGGMVCRVFRNIARYRVSETVGGD
jgi:hypothetical protein